MIDRIDKIYKRAIDIVNKNDIEWIDKYDLIFSKSIYGSVYFDWDDTEVEYKDDIVSFMNGFHKYMNEIKKA